MSALTIDDRPVMVDVCSGIGGFALSGEWAGFRPALFCEIDPYCRRVLAKHWPEVPCAPNLFTLTGDLVRHHLAFDYRGASDVSDTESGEDDERERSELASAAGVGWGRNTASFIGSQHVALLTGGIPCFAAGTLVLTRYGYQPIEDLEAGDFVLTHLGRWRQITSVMQRDDADLVRVDAQGVEGILTTAEHPFYARAYRKSYPRLPNGKRGNQRVFLDPEWVDAGNLGNRHFVSQVLPEIGSDKRTPSFWWLVGRCLADGWIIDRIGRKDAGKVVLACSFNEAELVDKFIGAAGFHGTRSDERTVVKFHIFDNEFFRFFRQFGRYAYGKNLPGFVYELDPNRSAALLEGWISGDGYRDDANHASRGTTVSKQLAYSMALLAQRAYGVVASVRLCTVPARTIIEGRTVNQRPFWIVTIPDRNHVAFVEDSYGWKRVRSTVPAGVGRVYNISVDEDESYVADGCIVHNCQPFSLAGRQRGADDDRHLWPQMLRLTQELRPAYVVIENVAGFIRMALDDVCLDLETAGYEVQPLVFPACGVGAWHKRERVFIIAHDANAARLRGAAIERHEPHGDVSGNADAPDADCLRQQQWQAFVTEGGNGTGNLRTDVPYAASERVERDGRSDEHAHQWLSWQGGAPLESIWQSEPPVGRVALRISKRVDRLRALGNCVVPQQAYPVLAAIREAL